MTPEERALLRQDELEIEWRMEFVKEFKNENLELQIVIEQAYKDTNLLLSRLAAARAGERDMLEKACRVMCHWCREGKPLLKVKGLVSHHSLPDDGKPDLYKSMTKVTVVECNSAELRKLMAELFPVAESEKGINQ